MFLRRHGYGEGALLAVAAEAERVGAPAHRVLIARGSISEDEYYRRLAEALGLPFFDACRATLHPLTAALCTERAPLWTRVVAFRDESGGAMVCLAPEGPDVAKLFQARLAGLPVPLAVAKPSAVRRCVLESGGPAVVDRIVDPLGAARPDLSARHTPRRLARAAALIAPALAAGGALAWRSAEALQALAVLGMLFFGLAIWVRCLAFAYDERRRAAPEHRPLHDRDLPTYTLLVPLYREAALVEELLQALQAIDYPAAKREILVLVEADDRDTVDAVRRADPCGRVCRLVRVPPGEPRGKPRALQIGLACATGEALTIYDADDAPDPGQLRAAAAALRAGGPRLACVQAPLLIDRGGTWIERQFALEYAALFQLQVPALAREKAVVLLGGTSNHFRTGALRAVHGWDAWNVTEDADLGIRLARAGYEVGVIAPPTREEAPRTVGGWLGQRRRWIKGWMQTALVHFGQPRNLVHLLGWRRAGMLCGWLGGTLGAALLFPFALPGMVLAIATFDPDAAMPATVAGAAFCVFATGLVLPLWLIRKGAARLGYALRLDDFVTVPAYWLLGSLAAWSALVALARRPFHWVKTAHRGRAARRLDPLIGSTTRSARSTPRPWRRASGADARD